MKKTITAILLIMLLCGSTVSSAFGKETDSKEKFDQDTADNIVERIDEYVQPYLGTDTLVNYDNGRAIQCHAFTNYIWRNVFGYDVYSSKCKRTAASTDYDNLGAYVNEYARPGDMLRVDGKHSMVITEFDEDTVTGYDWLYNKKERKCTYTWEGVKEWGDGTQSYWLYQIDESVYSLFEDSDYKIKTSFTPKPSDTEKDEKPDKEDEEPVNNPQEDDEKDKYGKIIVQINNPVMTANGEYLNIDEAGTAPVIVNDRTVLPIRAIVEAMGGNVGWNNDTRTVGIYYKDVNVEMSIDATEMKVNGKAVQMDVAPAIINERTMIPVRYITESLGGEVEWFDSIQAVAITYEK